MKTLKKIIICTTILFALFTLGIKKTNAWEGDNGSGNVGGATQGGSWQSEIKGLRIAVVDKDTKEPIKNAKVVNIVTAKTKNSSNIKFKNYLKITGKHYDAKVVTDSGVPGIDKTGVFRKTLEKNDYKLLKKYIRETGYKCTEESDFDKNRCDDIDNYRFIVEPMAVIGTNPNYTFYTGYELAENWNSNLTSVYQNLANAIYNKSKDAGAYYSNDGCSNGKDCQSNLRGKNGLGFGMFKNPLTKKMKSIKIKKSWKYNGREISSSRSATFKIETKTKTGWTTYKKDIKLSGSQLEISIAIPQKYTYRITETGQSATGYNHKSTTNQLKCGKKVLSASSPKLTKSCAGENGVATFTNVYDKNTVGKHSVTIYPKQLQSDIPFTYNKYGLKESNPETTNPNIYAYETINENDYGKVFYFKRLYGGNARSIVDNDHIQVKQLYGQIDQKTEELINTHWEWDTRYKISRAENAHAIWLASESNENFERCKDVIGTELHTGEAIGGQHLCFQLCTKMWVNKTTNVASTQKATDQDVAQEVCYTGTPLSGYDDNQRLQWFDEGNKAQKKQQLNNKVSEWLKTYSKNARYELQKKSGSSYQTIQTVDYNPSMEKVEFNNVNNGEYRIRQICDSDAVCGHGNTFIKVYNPNIAYVTGATSSGFKFNASNGVSQHILISVINNNKTLTCTTELQNIRNGNYSDEEVKQKLINLYNDEAKQGHNYNKLLNYFANSTAAQIKSGIDNHNIACEYQAPQKTSTSSTCNDLKLGDNDIDQKSLASFINGNNNAKGIASSLFNLDLENDDLYCYVSYNANLDQKIVRDGVKLFNKSFLYSSNPSNQLGTLNAKVFCVGNSVYSADDLKKSIKNETLHNLINDVQVTYKKGNTNVVAQNLKILTDKNKIEYDTHKSGIKVDDIDQIDSDLCESGDSDDGYICKKSNGTTYCPTSYVKGHVMDDDGHIKEACVEPKYKESSYCNPGSTYDEGICIDETGNPYCTDDYDLSEDKTSCIRKEEGDSLLKNASLCKSGTEYVDNACYDSDDDNISCPSGYDLDWYSYKCYKEEETSATPSDSDPTFKYFTSEISLPIVYAKKRYANILNGTCDEDNSDGQKASLGWGICINDKQIKDKIYFNYELDDSSDIYNLLKETSNDMNSTYTGTCDFEKEVDCDGDDCGDIIKGSKNNLKVRFIDSKKPFPGKTGKSRDTGFNWNSCYTAILNKINTRSKISCQDINRCSINDPDKYCYYGDYDCDGNIDENITSEIMNKLNNDNSYGKQLWDFNEDGLIDASDKNLMDLWKCYNGDSSSCGGNDKIAVLCKWHKDNYNDQGSLINKYISQKQDSKSNDTPMYSFVLSASDIQKIRSYNNQKENKCFGEECKEVDAHHYNSTNNLMYDNSDYISGFINDLINNNNQLSISDSSGKCLANKSNRKICRNTE